MIKILILWTPAIRIPATHNSCVKPLRYLLLPSILMIQHWIYRVHRQPIRHRTSGDYTTSSACAPDIVFVLRESVIYADRKILLFQNIIYANKICHVHCHLHNKRPRCVDGIENTEQQSRRRTTMTQSFTDDWSSNQLWSVAGPGTV